MQKLKDKLELQEKQGIIRKVTEPTAWVHPMVVVLKKCGGIRVTVDFRFLNDEIIRPRFKSLTPFQAVRTIPKGMRFFYRSRRTQGLSSSPARRRTIRSHDFLDTVWQIPIRPTPNGHHSRR
jgi:hypothetical protein